MGLHVLGPVTLHAAGTDHPLGSIKERTVVAILALSSGRAVSTAALLTQVWDGRPPPKAPASLASYASRLRRRLRDILGDDARISRESAGYALMVPPGTVDLDRFRELVRQGKAIWQSGDGERAATLLRQADELWRGEALAGLPGEWIRRVRHGLDEERRDACHVRIDIELELGHHSALIGELNDLTARYPLDERLIGQLMLALFRSDRQADALTLYHQTRDALVEAQGAEPGHRLSDLYQRILAGDLDLAADPRRRRPGQHMQPDTIPPDTDQFVGRFSELEELFSKSERGTTPVVITGMPGVGKTTLAIRTVNQIADRYPDDPLFLDLGAYSPTRIRLDPAAALAALLRMIDIPAERIPRTLAERAAMWQRATAGRRTVLLLDDAADAEQVRPLLPRSPTCAVLITSRNRLRGLSGCHRLELDVMTSDDAAGLFIRLSGMDAEKHRDVVHATVRHCGYLPLAIRVTARQFRQVDGPRLTELVDDLAGRARSAAGRDPQVAGAFELSYRSMPTDHQEVFRRLGLHPCREMTPQSAAALVSRPLIELRPMFEDLVDRSLIQRTADDTYRFHDLIRDYAHQRAVAEEPRPRSLLGRLLGYYLKAGGTADQILFPHRRRLPLHPSIPLPDEPVPASAHEADSWMRTEWHHVLEAARYAMASEWKLRGTQLIHVLAEYLDMNGHWQEAVEHHKLALHACREIGDQRSVAQALAELGFARLRTADHKRALDCATEALAIHRRLGDKGAQAEILDYMGGVYWSSGRSRKALAYLQEALDIHRSLGHTAGEALTLAHTGASKLYLGRYEDATADLHASLELCRELGDRRGVARALNNLGDVERQRGYHRDAIRLYQESLEIFQETSDSQNSAVLQNNIGKVRRYKGQYDEALSLHRKALREFRANGDRRNAADALDSIGMTYQLMEAYSEALVHHEQAEAISTEISDAHGVTRALRGIADALRGNGRYQEALDRYEEALTIARNIGDSYQEAMIHDGIGQVFGRTQRSRMARIHWRQAFDLFEQLGVVEAEALRIRLDATNDTLNGFAAGMP